ncbi:MAG: FAD-dependent oxidoreductase [Bacteroidota bacterium]
MPRKWYDGRVIRIADESSTTRRFWIQVDELERFDFRAGQFVTFDLPISEKRRERWRSYSIASAPDGTNVFELCIVRLEGGRGTTYLFDEVKEGTILSFKGPDGVFTLPKNLDREIVLICTGTGVAPFRSMLGALKESGGPKQLLHLIFGTRHEEGILYREEMETLAKEWPNFRFDVALSREKDWDGYQGYVHQVYQEHYPEVDADRLFLLCGWQNMVDEAVDRLTEKMGYAKQQVVFELYG